jgi:hypothetical protein
MRRPWPSNPKTRCSNPCAGSTPARARFEDALRDLSARLSSIEGYLATFPGDLVRHRGEIESLKARVDRIERRLDLADAPS